MMTKDPDMKVMILIIIIANIIVVTINDNKNAHNSDKETGSDIVKRALDFSKKLLL